MSNFSFDYKRFFKPGTPACSTAYAVIGVIVAVLLLTIGLWKTLFIFAFGAAGALLGGIGDKKAAVRDAVNRRFPAKDEPIKDMELEHNDIAEITEKIEQSANGGSHAEEHE